MFINNKKLLITGAGGFIGSFLTKTLINYDCEINILIRNSTNKWRIVDILDNVNVFYVDLDDYEKLKKIIKQISPDVVFHLAVYGIYRGQNDFVKIIQTNFLNTVNFLQILNDLPIELFVNMGTCSEYGTYEKKISENFLLKPFDFYGASKAAISIFCETFYRKYGFPVVNLRIFPPYGYFDEKHRFIPWVILNCLKNDEVTTTFGEQKRDYIFIEDVIDGILSCVNHKDRILGETFNIGTGKEYSLKELAYMIKKLTKSNSSLNFGALPYRENEMFHCCADISKIKKKIKWKPKYTIEEGLKKTVLWFKENIKYYI